jgi:SnoaL-like polyketide cyclase
MAIQRMVQAGVVPLTLVVFASQLRRDWAREETAGKLAEILLDRGGASATNLAWELQLLTSRPGVGGRHSPPIGIELCERLGLRPPRLSFAGTQKRCRARAISRTSTSSSLTTSSTIRRSPTCPPTSPLHAALYKALRGAFPDFHAVIHWQTAESEIVTTFKSYHGTHQGPFPGRVAVRPEDPQTVDTMRVHNGKITEQWGVANPH